jgi:transposase
MQGKKDIQPKMLYQLSISDLVPADNFYRQLSKELDLNFLYRQTRKYYGKEGQESIDPVVFFKICLVGYLNNINSDRQLMRYCGNCIDVRYYLRYDLDEALPWHSTISRTRQLYGEEVFLCLFKKVLAKCIEKGMVRGKRQAMDSAFVKANASLDSLQEKEVLADVEKYSGELAANSEHKMATARPPDKSNKTVTKARQKDVEQHHDWKKEAYKNMPGHGKKDEGKSDGHGNTIRPRYLSNHTHYSTTDPDARISVKPGKARQLNYYAQIAVDDSHHVITGAGADFSDKRDSECLEHIANQTIENLSEHDIKVEQLLADTGYSSGKALKYCKEKGIAAYIPNFGQYKHEREGFIYDQEKDRYECTRGNQAILPYRKTLTDSKGYTKKIYRSDNSKCKSCPLRSRCIGKTDFKKIEDSIYKPWYDEMHERLQSDYAKKIMKKRGSTVEPVLGTMLNFLNLKRVNTRGIQQANKHVMMAALTYNLKKYMKYIAKKPTMKAMAFPKDHEIANQFIDFFKASFEQLKRAFLRHSFFETEWSKATFCPS